MKEKKTFDAVVFPPRRREEPSRAYGGPSARQIEENVQQALQDDPLWQRQRGTRAPSSKKKTGGRPWYSEPCSKDVPDRA